MRKVKREEILDYVTYNERRYRIRESVLKVKAPRRVHLGSYLTFLFENTETIRYQIQEMMRAERIVKEESILYEIHTYNELLGGNGELGCVLLIEVDEAEERNRILRIWLGLQERIYLTLDSGERVYAEWDRRQVDDTKLSSVQYLKFKSMGRIPSAIGVDHPEMKEESPLAKDQIEALTGDLAAKLGPIYRLKKE